MNWSKRFIFLSFLNQLSKLDSITHVSAFFAIQQGREKLCCSDETIYVCENLHCCRDVVCVCLYARSYGVKFSILFSCLATCFLVFWATFWFSFDYRTRKNVQRKTFWWLLRLKIFSFSEFPGSKFAMLVEYSIDGGNESAQVRWSRRARDAASDSRAMRFGNLTRGLCTKCLEAAGNIHN